MAVLMFSMLDTFDTAMRQRTRRKVSRRNNAIDIGVERTDLHGIGLRAECMRRSTPIRIRIYPRLTSAEFLAGMKIECVQHGAHQNSHRKNDGLAGLAPLETR